ncbi:MAG: protoporphyrinogen oxidase [Nitrospinota bacterium]
MSESVPKKKVVIIGGGITGLAACYRILDEARRGDLRLEVSLLEASERFGGTIETSRQAGCLLEHGPDCFLSTKPAGLSLCKELGLAESLIGTNPQCRKSFILRGNSLLPVPQGFYLLAPSSFLPFLATPLFSPFGKLRMTLELLIPRRRAEGDETLASFVRRRFGREALERMAQPLAAGIYSADPEELSLEATFPQFLDMERERRSIILALRNKMRKGGAGETARGPRYGLFVSLREGLGGLVNALLERIPGRTLRPGCRVISVRREAGRWRVRLQGGEEMEADALCLALPAAAASAIVRDAAPRMAEALGGIPYGSVGTLNLVFGAGQVSHPLDGMGFVVPAVEGHALLACSFSSRKFEGRAPEGKVLLRAFFTGTETNGAFALPDDAVIERLVGEVRAVLGIEDDPEATLLRRYPRSMPQYGLGHLDRVRAIEQEAERLPGLTVAGSALRGVGIPDCVAGANEAAARLLKYLRAG